MGWIKSSYEDKYLIFKKNNLKVKKKKVYKKKFLIQRSKQFTFATESY
jgi:hypothetical protein